MNYAKKVTKKISDRATKFGQREEDKNIFEDEIDELQKLAADNMALAELAAKWAADARRETMQQKDVVAELTRETMSDVAESQQQSESPESSRDPSLADPDTPGRTAQVITNLQEVANDNDYDFKYTSSDSEENEVESEDEAPAAAKKPDAVPKKPPAVPNVDDDVSDSEENEMEFEDESPAAAKKPAAVAKKPSTVPNVDDEGSSANDNKPLDQLFEKKVSKPQKGAATKQKKRSGSLQKNKEKGKQTKIVAGKPAAPKKKNEKKNETRSSTSVRAKCAREAQVATVAKSATTPVTRSDTRKKTFTGDI
jgi:hypothetical protein